MNNRNTLRLLFATPFCLLCGLTACSDDTRVTLHEAHVYKGNLDPHQTDQATRKRTLKTRFQQVFTDR